MRPEPGLAMLLPPFFLEDPFKDLWIEREQTERDKLGLERKWNKVLKTEWAQRKSSRKEEKKKKKRPFFQL